MEFDRGPLLEIFTAECDENVHRMEDLLADAMDSDGLVGDGGRPLADALFRIAHTLKGNASSMGFSAFARFAHSVEELLALVRGGQLTVSRDVVGVLFEAADAFRELSADAVAGRDALRPEHERLVGRFTEVASRRGAAPAEGGAGRVGARGGAPVETVRVRLELVDKMLGLAGELSIARGRIRRMIEAAGGAGRDEILRAHDDADAIHADLQEQVVKLRMVPLRPMLRQYARAVKGLSESLGKEARLEIVGADTELDAALVQALADPLTHMIRNALDHGIEPPEVRERLGKSRVGLVMLSARHEGGAFVLEVSDDGAGLKRDVIAARAKELGVAWAETASDADLFQLLFEPGFSTAREVSDVSGRGVGMDVVKHAVEGARGSVAIAPRSEGGTRVTLRLPLTVATIDGFLVRVGAETLVIPMDAVVSCRRAPAAEGPLSLVRVRDEALPCLGLASLFGLPSDASARGQELVVVRHGDLQAGLIVDELAGASQVVLKAKTGLLRGFSAVSGSTILPSGKVAFVLDMGELLRLGRRARQVPPQRGVSP